jgi:hypothetical protein
MTIPFIEHVKEYDPDGSVGMVYRWLFWSAVGEQLSNLKLHCNSLNRKDICPSTNVRTRHPRRVKAMLMPVKVDLP